MSRLRWLASLLVVSLSLTACGEVVQLDFPDLDAQPVHVPEQSIVYDSTGRELAVLRSQFRERVSLAQMPHHLIDAVIASEDQRFYQHEGVDARAVARAALRNVAEGEITQGGSTITQQLVKNLYMPDAPRTAETKLKEALLARQMEQEHDKDWILEEYLNTVYYGEGAYGVEAAARTYWSVGASELTLPQSAMLAALIRSPHSRNPRQQPDEARASRDEVIEAMRQQGYLTEEDAAQASSAPLALAPPPEPPPREEPRWVDFVTRTLLDDPSFGETEAERSARLLGGGLRIFTTLDPEMQQLAEETARSVLPDPEDPDVAIVTVEPDTGKILAAVGGLNYDQSQFDLATQSQRQPGSVFKAFVLAAAVTSGMGPEHEILGSPGVLDLPGGRTWQVRNYSAAAGLVSLERATRFSINGAFARLILEVGPGRVAALARAMGVTAPIEDEARIALGGLEVGVSPLDMASGFATLANLGEHVPATPIDRIEDASGRVVWRPDTTPRPVLDPSAAYVTTQMLKGVVEAGTGVKAQVPGWEVAGKTGTVQDNTDAWFVGYTPTLATAVWMGHAEGRIPMRWVQGVREVEGGTLPARLFRLYMSQALADSSPVDFSLPTRYYTMMQIDPETGLRAAEWCEGELTPVPRAIIPRETCPSPAPSPEPGPTSTAGPAGPTDSSSPDDPSPSPDDDGSPQPSPRPRPEPSPTPTSSPSPSPSPTIDGGSPEEPEPTPSPSPDGDGDAPSPSPTEDGG